MWARWSIILALGIAALVAQAAAVQALELRIETAGRTVVVADNGKLDRNQEAGAILYSGPVGEFLVSVAATEDSLPGRRYALSLNGAPTTDDPQALFLVNGGEPGRIAFVLSGTAAQPLGPRNRALLHYQGRFSDTADVNTRPAISENRLSATLGDREVAQILQPALQDQDQEQVFDQKGEPPTLADGEASRFGLSLQLTVGQGNALSLDEAKLAVEAVEAEFPPLALAAGLAVAIVITGGALIAFRSRR